MSGSHHTELEVAIQPLPRVRTFLHEATTTQGILHQFHTTQPEKIQPFSFGKLRAL